MRRVLAGEAYRISWTRAMRSLRTTLAASGLRVKLKASVMLRLRGKVRLAIVRRSEWSGEEAWRTWEEADA